MVTEDGIVPDWRTGVYGAIGRMDLAVLAASERQAEPRV